MRDHLGRDINYLRVSLTDHCNFKCLYCMPPEGVVHTHPENHLSQRELIRFFNLASQIGFKKVRFTGGEPTLRPDLIDLVFGVSRETAFSEIALTTNGWALKELAAPLKEAGLDRLNVSLDSLRRDRFFKITRQDCLENVLQGVVMAKKCGFPLKINMVVMRGENEDEVCDFVRYGLEEGVEIRFIEFMPLCGSAWSSERVFPLSEVKEKLLQTYQLFPVLAGEGQAAQEYVVKGTRKTGRVGFITTMTDPFCSTCSRMRLSVDGFLRPCLFSHESVDVGSLLRRQGSDQELLSVLRKTVWEKPAGNLLAVDEVPIPYFQGAVATTMPMIRSIGG